MSERLTALETSAMTIRGARSHLRLDGGIITVARDGDTVTAPSEISFPVSEVRGTSLETPSRGGRGWLHIAVVGGSPAPPSELAAVKDPYTLPLTGRGVGAARKLERLIEKHIKARGKPTDQVARPGGPSSRVSLAGSVRPVPAPPPASVPTARATAAEPPSPEATVPDEPAAHAPASDGPTPDRPTPAGARDEVAAPASGLVAELRELGELHRAGVLTDDEFRSAKAKLLG